MTPGFFERYNITNPNWQLVNILINNLKKDQVMIEQNRKKKDWQKFISDKEKLPDKDNHTSLKKNQKSQSNNRFTLDIAR